MWLKRGVHHLPAAEIERFIREGRQQGWEFYVLPETKAVVSVIARHQLVLATGHVSSAEGLLLVQEGRRQGVQHMVVTHAMNAPVLMTVAQMKEAASLGAMIEFVGGSLTTADADARMTRFADAIQKQGPGGVLGVTNVGIEVARGVVSFVVGVVAISFITFFMLLEGPRMHARFREFLPDDYRTRIEIAFAELERRQIEHLERATAREIDRRSEVGALEFENRMRAIREEAAASGEEDAEGVIEDVWAHGQQ